MNEGLDLMHVHHYGSLAQGWLDSIVPLNLVGGVWGGGFVAESPSMSDTSSTWRYNNNRSNSRDIVKGGSNQPRSRAF